MRDLTKAQWIQSLVDKRATHGPYSDQETADYVAYLTKKYAPLTQAEFKAATQHGRAR